MLLPRAHQTAHGAIRCLVNCHLVGENAQNPPKKLAGLLFNYTAGIAC